MQYIQGSKRKCGQTRGLYIAKLLFRSVVCGIIWNISILCPQFLLQSLNNPWNILMIGMSSVTLRSPLSV